MKCIRVVLREKHRRLRQSHNPNTVRNADRESSNPKALSEFPSRDEKNPLSLKT
jgi:hypothetical protein